MFARDVRLLLLNHQQQQIPLLEFEQHYQKFFKWVSAYFQREFVDSYLSFSSTLTGFLLSLICTITKALHPSSNLPQESSPVMAVSPTGMSAFNQSSKVLFDIDIILFLFNK